MSAPDGMVPLTLVPVEVFGEDDCCEHGMAADSAECPSTGYGLSDAVPAWSDCNRASGRIYRVEDIDGRREPGDTMTVWVEDVHLPWFERRFGDGPDNCTRRLLPNEPEIVVLCGSTRFKDAFYSEGKRLSFEGRIVLSVSDLDPAPENRHVNVPIDPERKAMLDDLHRRKIDLAHRVHVLNVGGYIGDSTRGEIAYAEAQGKPVTYMVPRAD